MIVHFFQTIIKGLFCTSDRLHSKKNTANAMSNCSTVIKTKRINSLENKPAFDWLVWMVNSELTDHDRQTGHRLKTHYLQSFFFWFPFVSDRIF